MTIADYTRAVEKVARKELCEMESEVKPTRLGLSNLSRFRRFNSALELPADAWTGRLAPLSRSVSGPHHARAAP